MMRVLEKRERILKILDPLPDIVARPKKIWKNEYDFVMVKPWFAAVGELCYGDNVPDEMVVSDGVDEWLWKKLKTQWPYQYYSVWELFSGKPARFVGILRLRLLEYPHPAWTPAGIFTQVDDAPLEMWKKILPVIWAEFEEEEFETLWKTLWNSADALVEKGYEVQYAEGLVVLYPPHPMLRQPVICSRPFGILTEMHIYGWESTWRTLLRDIGSEDILKIFEEVSA